MRKAVLAVLGVVASLVVLEACGSRKVETGADMPPDAGAEAGAEAVFGELAVLIEVGAYDAVDFEARDATGAPSPAPPIEPRASARVIINGGTAEGRVRGLEVLAEGQPLREVGNAAFPQSFDFQHYPAAVAHGQVIELQLRYQGATFPVRLETPNIELTSPAPDEVVPADRALALSWTGAPAEPREAMITTASRSAGCVLTFKRSNATTFLPERGASGQEPPCRFEASASWHVDVSTPASPFRSLVIKRSSRRIQRFSVQ